MNDLIDQVERVHGVEAEADQRDVRTLLAAEWPDRLRIEAAGHDLVVETARRPD